MSKEELLKQYRKDVTAVKRCAKDLGLSDREIKGILKESFLNVKNEVTSSTPTKDVTKAQILCRTFGYISVLFTILSIFIYIVLNVHQPTSSIVLRNVQGLTYPTLRTIRLLFVPLLKLFPALSDLYDESCLIENPYFYVADMECWPCEGVNAVVNVTKVDENALKSGSASPFVVKVDQELVTFQTLQALYTANKDVLDSEARRIKSTDPQIANPRDLFTNGLPLSSTTHIFWRINKMTAARAVRTVFNKPFFLSDRSGQSVERFIMIDGAKAEPYVLPNTECSYVFIIQGSGERTIVLRPSRECSNECRTISVDLKPSYVLWYNWWYWRPISLPTRNSTGPSISYINSYC